MLQALSSQTPRAPQAPGPLQLARTEAEAGGGGASVGPQASALRARATLLSDATEHQAAWLEAVHEARTTLKVSLDALTGPGGNALARALARRAEQGVRVQVLAWGPRSAEREAALAEARARGLLVRSVPAGTLTPVGQWLVADDRVALLGAHPPRGRVARAGLLRLAGEAAWELGRFFNADWAAAGGAPATLPEPPTVFAATSQATVRLGGVGHGRRSARGILLAALRGARSSVVVLADVLTDPDVVAALVAAQGRGVSVRVLLDDAGLAPDATWAARLGLDEASAAAASLKAAGLDVRVLTAGALAMRAAVVDEATLVIATTPWTRTGFAAQGEWLAAVQEPTMAGVLAAAFASDWETAMPVEIARTPTARLLALAAGAVRPALAALSRLAAHRWRLPELRVGVVRVAGRWQVVAEAR
ncbi:MAG: phospholipase D-like domain-containing protein [Candidatus Sericytochromatia bacterium]|nr:phospholipase D-like domain-containing protein [Candidatus Sericytochromatia bacterium]